MSASRCCRNATGAALALVASAFATEAPAQTGALVRYQLTSVVGSGDLVGPRSGGSFRTLPWDAAGTRLGTSERLLRASLLRRDVGGWHGLRTTALFRFEIDMGGKGADSRVFHDLSSYLGASLDLARDFQLGLRLFPFDTDYVRGGWLHALDWGGTDRTRRESVFLNQRGGAPGMVLDLELPRVRLFAGVKWAMSSDPLQGDARLFGAISGLSAALLPALQAEAQFGYFARPRRSTFEQGFVECASARLVWHQAPDEPEVATEPLRPPSLREDATSLDARAPLGAAAAIEASALVLREGRTEGSDVVSSTAPALGLMGSWRGRRLGFHAVGTWRSLLFTTRDDTRIDPTSLPRKAARAGEISAWIGGTFATDFGLVTGVESGFDLPAALGILSGAGTDVRAFVTGGPGGLTALPTGSSRLPLVAARMSVRQRLSPCLLLAVFADFWHDPNRVRLTDVGNGPTRSYDRPDSLELLLFAEAGF